MALITHAEPEQGRAGYCWVILAVAFVLTFLTLGKRSTLGVFFKAMVDDLGWGRGTLSMVAAVNIWLGGCLTPFILSVISWTAMEPGGCLSSARPSLA
jgi:hypothetical protein